jgi:hypothetical protein
MSFPEETFDKTLSGVPLLVALVCVCNKQDVRFVYGTASEQKALNARIAIRSRDF